MRNARHESARAYARILSSAPEIQLVQMLFVMPPVTLIRDMVEAASDSKLVIGAQTFHPAEEGEFTGELSIKLLRQEGARIVLVGHAERRLLFGETDEAINKKVSRAFASGIVLLLDLRPDQSRGRERLRPQMSCFAVPTDARELPSRVDNRR